MIRKDFIAFIETNRKWIDGIEKAAFEMHNRVNQQYGEFLPYGFHLKLTASYVSRYGHLVVETELDILILYAAAYLHDTIEDTRLTYNDIVRFIRDFRVEGIMLSDTYYREIALQVPEIVYALTNEKGRKRDERANDIYYKGIRETRFAPFVKMCDRLANLKFTVMFVFSNYMFDVYKREYPHFIQAITSGAVTIVPEEMKKEAEELLDSEVYVLKE